MADKIPPLLPPWLSKGDRGATGDLGPTGSTGATGQDGSDGSDGRDGARGHRGPMGMVVLPKGFLWGLASASGLTAFLVAGVMSYLTTHAVQGREATRSARVERKAATLVYDAGVAGCDRAVKDRAGRIRTEAAGMKADRVVASDKLQSQKTRDARRAQANIQEASLRDFETRVPVRLRVTRQGKLIPEFRCKDLFPKP